MKASQLDREIKVVKHIIGQLHQCLEIYHDAKMYDEIQATLKDIKTCKNELKRLINQKTYTESDVQGEIVNGADDKRVRKTFQ